MWLLGLLACTGTGPEVDGGCVGTLVPVRVAGCYAAPEDTAATGGEDSGGTEAQGDWEGLVAEVVTGPFAATCGVQVGDEDDGSGWVARVDTPGGRVEVGVAVPGSNPPAVGDTVRVRAADRDGARHVEVSAGGVILGYVGAARTLDALSPLGIGLSLGDPTCLEQDPCGDWRGHGLDVEVGTAEPRGVPYGTTAVLGTFTVTNGDLRAASGVATCTDVDPAIARVGIGR